MCDVKEKLGSKRNSKKMKDSHKKTDNRFKGQNIQNMQTKTDWNDCNFSQLLSKYLHLRPSLRSKKCELLKYQRLDQLIKLDI